MLKLSHNPQASDTSATKPSPKETSSPTLRVSAKPTSSIINIPASTISTLNSSKMLNKPKKRISGRI